MNLDKAQTWKLAKDLGCIDTIIKSTMTDYNGSKNENDWGLGNLDNPASIQDIKVILKQKKINGFKIKYSRPLYWPDCEGKRFSLSQQILLRKKNLKYLNSIVSNSI